MNNNQTILIIGLGNPGEQYATTPHNAGFLTIDRLITDYQLSAISYVNLKSEIAETKINSQKIILAKPQTFMNKSGEAVLAVTKNYKLQPKAGPPQAEKAISSLWVVHDDIDLELGQIKIVRNRGSAGHKGVEDIIKKLKTQDFVRFRIGIRPKKLPAHRSKTLMNKFVVSRFSNAEEKFFGETIERCKTAIQFALDKGTKNAANVYNK